MNNFDGLLEKIAQCSMKKLAVAVAQDDAVIEAVRAAKDRKIADAILVGDADEITKIAAEINMDLSSYEIIDVKDKTEAALTAVQDCPSYPRQDILLRYHVSGAVQYLTIRK